MEWKTGSVRKITLVCQPSKAIGSLLSCVTGCSRPARSHITCGYNLYSSLMGQEGEGEKEPFASPKK